MTSIQFTYLIEIMKKSIPTNNLVADYIVVELILVLYNFYQINVLLLETTSFFETIKVKVSVKTPH